MKLHVHQQLKTFELYISNCTMRNTCEVVDILIRVCIEDGQSLATIKALLTWSEMCSGLVTSIFNSRSAGFLDAVSIFSFIRIPEDDIERLLKTLVDFCLANGQTWESLTLYFEEYALCYGCFEELIDCRCMLRGVYDLKRVRDAYNERHKEILQVGNHRWTDDWIESITRMREENPTQHLFPGYK